MDNVDGSAVVQTESGADENNIDRRINNINPNENNSEEIDLRKAINNLKCHVNRVMSLKKSSENQEQIQQIYRNDMLPYILLLRHLYRSSKDSLEEQVERVKKLNQQLVSLSLACDSILFEADFLNYEVMSNKDKLTHPKKHRIDKDGDVEMLDEVATSKLKNGTSSYFDADEVGRLDHETRTKLLNEEETKRKDLQEKLAQLSKVTENIEVICNESASQFSAIKPYMKQLVDAVRTSKLANNDLFNKLGEKSS